MKICMLAPEFLPVWGGVGTYIVELVRHLPKSVEIHVVTPSRKKSGGIAAETSDYDFDDYFSHNVHVHLISSATDTFFYNAIFQQACFRFVPKLIKQERIDLIHSHTAHMPDILLQFRGLKVPKIATVHTTIAGQRRGAKESGMKFRDLEFSEKATYVGYPVLRLAEQVFFSSKRRYVTVSNWMKAQLLQMFPKLCESDVRVIQNSVDTTFFSPTTAKTGKTVLFTGRLVAAKGLIYLVDAIPQVLLAHPDAFFTFVGPGDSSPYEDRLNSLGVPKKNYAFLGYLKDRKQLLEAYRNSSIFVAPTLYENLPIRILEAMACAKAVVATNVCAIPEVISSPKDGILVPPKSSRTLSKAICDLLQAQDRREEIGRRARQTVVERFDWASNVQKMTRFYEESIERSLGLCS
jgi:glycosyltransferase involved in cell wall biosynthesis